MSTKVINMLNVLGQVPYKICLYHWSDHYLNVLSVPGILFTALMWYLKCSYIIEPVSFTNIAG